MPILHSLGIITTGSFQVNGELIGLKLPNEISLDLGVVYESRVWSAGQRRFLLKALPLGNCCHCMVLKSSIGIATCSLAKQSFGVASTRATVKRG